MTMKAEHRSKFAALIGNGNGSKTPNKTYKHNKQRFTVVHDSSGINAAKDDHILGI